MSRLPHAGAPSDGPLVFITGASSGIGQALAARAAAEGGRLALVARRQADVEQWVAAQGWPASRARAWRAIAAGDSYRVIPWPMAIVAALLRVLPDAWFDRLFAGRGRKPRRGA